MIDVKTAYISDCKVYRYVLTRRWAEGEVLVIIMLNPSTADAELDDPTIRRCIGFAKSHGYGGIIVINLYAFRATDPRDLDKAEDPIGPDNNKVIVDIALAHPKIMCGWGAQGGARADAVTKLLRNAGATLYCLGKSKNGSPRHPLYVPAAKRLELF